MRILFLSQRVPYPPNRGDKITTWRLVERMKRHHDVTAIAFAHNEADFAAARELTEEKGIPTIAFAYDDRAKKLASLPLLLGRTPLTLGVYGSKELQRRVDDEMRSADMAYAYSSSMGAFLEPHADRPRVMHFGELDSDKWRQYAETASFPMSWVYRREARTLLEFESRVARSFHTNVVCTPLEQQIFERQIPGATARVLRNGVDLEYYHPALNTPDPDEIVFTGVMNYFPNVDACRFFVEDVLPIVRQSRPLAHFTIIGSQPTRDVVRLAQVPGVRVTGFVNDTRDHLRKAVVSVAPLRIARGIQNKVLEAMAMGLPVVGTTPATQGVDGASGRDYLVADDAHSFAHAVVELLEKPDDARALGERARTFVEAHYDWEVVFRPLDDILASCASKTASADARTS
ncbi:MAG: TIGR03087 family PEP-CTERM/XrtA system glycosyltransferase [Planctomycetota bacterium]